MIETSAPWGEELALALAMIEEAGAIVREGRSRGALSFVGKVGFEIVTEIDLAVDRHIAARISEAWPDHRIISEENEERGGERWNADLDRRSA